jgi:serine/threonine protein kinase
VEVGRVLADRYEIVRPLADGAMSTVWVALDRATSVEVAIKAISLDAAGWRAEVRDRFVKEARLLALGKHEHLVGVRDVGETDDGFLYLVLDLLEGETLAARLARETRLDWKEATALALGITRGVAALHRAGIVHRDLKPANIVLSRTSDGIVPTIIDLGIGKVAAAVGDPELCATLTATGQVLGTPQYMSYEQALGQTNIDARTDVWALGVILYEMLVGVRPFEAPNTNAVLAAIRRNAVKAIRDAAPNVPVSVASVVERCLSTDRSARFDDAGALSLQLEAAMKQPVTTTVATTEVRTHRRRLWFVVALVVSVVALPIVLIVVARAAPKATKPAHETAANVNPASTMPAPVITPSSSASLTPPAAEPLQQNASPTVVPIIRRLPVVKRSGTPATRVDEAGF